MAILAFEHAINVKNPYKKAVMAMGSGGEIIHCEIIFQNFGYQIGSSWNPKGTEIRSYEVNRNHNNWLYYDLGMQYEYWMYDYINQRVNKGYTLSGLVTNMILKMDVSYKEQNFCSELCFETLKYAGGLNLPDVPASNISPNDLHRIILEYPLNQVFL